MKFTIDDLANNVDMKEVFITAQNGGLTLSISTIDQKIPIRVVKANSDYALVEAVLVPKGSTHGFEEPRRIIHPYGSTIGYEISK